jgi:hypothetical protein
VRFAGVDTFDGVNWKEIYFFINLIFSFFSVGKWKSQKCSTYFLFSL